MKDCEGGVVDMIQYTESMEATKEVETASKDAEVIWLLRCESRADGCAQSGCQTCWNGRTWFKA